MANLPGRLRRLMLFDVDGTLLHQGGMGSRALGRAFRERHALHDALADLRLDGKTDRSICREVFERHGLGFTDRQWTGIVEAYLGCLEQEARERPSGRLCPGVRELLDALSARGDCALGLLTGNVRQGAEIKLRTFGLWEYFSIGAFGCDRELRSELVAVALERAEQHFGERFEPAGTLVIGDTPADIEAARAGGCISVAVATGRYGLSELRACEPDVLLEHLGELQRTLGAFGLDGVPT
jgi:phosphoglycolate phosphatase